MRPTGSPNSRGEGAPELSIGQLVDGRFRVERVLGRGGSSVVYAAFDQTTGVAVAMKVLQRPDAITEERLLREARALAALTSARVTRFVHCGTFSTHEPYLVTELAKGTDLRVVLQERGAFPIREAIDIVLQL